MPYQLLADAVLLAHLTVVVFVVGGLAAIVAGNLRGWRWVNGFRLRFAHLTAIAFIVVQEWLGQACPLTTLESWLRMRSGTAGYERGLVEDWVQAILFHEAPGWVFALAYTAFGLLVVAAWWRFPPGGRHEGQKSGD